MSETVSKALELTGGMRAQETAKFVSVVDKFFDCLNVNDYNMHWTLEEKDIQAALSFRN